MAIRQLQYSAHDLCLSLFVPLNCDGTVADETETLTLDGALTGAETDIPVTDDLTALVDVIPPYGELILDAGGADIELGYSSFDADSFTLITGDTPGAAVADAVSITVARSTLIAHCGLTQTRLVPLTTDEVIDAPTTAQCVVAGRPSNSPAWPNQNAPAQTEQAIAPLLC